jgi:hypothetical protein
MVCLFVRFVCLFREFSAIFPFVFFGLVAGVKASDAK